MPMRRNAGICPNDLVDWPSTRRSPDEIVVSAETSHGGTETSQVAKLVRTTSANRWSLSSKYQYTELTGSPDRWQTRTMVAPLTPRSLASSDAAAMIQSRGALGRCR